MPWSGVQRSPGARFGCRHREHLADLGDLVAASVEARVLVDGAVVSCRPLERLAREAEGGHVGDRCARRHHARAELLERVERLALRRVVAGATVGTASTKGGQTPLRGFGALQREIGSA